jgi:hypothetical protein
MDARRPGSFFTGASAFLAAATRFFSCIPPIQPMFSKRGRST